MKYKQKAAGNHRTVKSERIIFVLCPEFGESCLIFNWHSSRAASGISFFRVPTKDDEYSINWRNNIAVVIACDTTYGDEAI